MVFLRFICGLKVFFLSSLLISIQNLAVIESKQTAHLVHFAKFKISIAAPL